jgi:hypothetical protein
VEECKEMKLLKLLRLLLVVVICIFIPTVGKYAIALTYLKYILLLLVPISAFIMYLKEKGIGVYISILVFAFFLGIAMMPLYNATLDLIQGPKEITGNITPVKAEEKLIGIIPVTNNYLVFVDGDVMVRAKYSGKDGVYTKYYKNLNVVVE